MRFSIIASSLVSLVVTALLPVRAEVQPLSENEASFGDPRPQLVSLILDEIGARREARPSEPLKSWLSELAGYYGAPGARPLWMSESGLTQNGVALVAAMRSADRWGLDPFQFEVALPPENASLPELAAAELRLSLAATKYAWHARGGRIDPSELSLWLDQKPRVVYASEVLGTLERSGAIAAGLESFHPQHAGFALLRQAYLEARGLTLTIASEPHFPIDGPVLAKGDRHPDVLLVRQRLGVEAGSDGDQDLVDSDVIAAVRRLMSREGYGRKRVIDHDVRRVLSRLVGRDTKGDKAELVAKLIVNMERWRWMPGKLGPFHVWNNLPEFKTRVVKDGQVVHEERIIIGQTGTQTPIFSDSMSHVIFNPEWGLPESIKIRQLLGRLRGGDYGVLKRRNMRIVADGKEISPSRFKWSKVNIADVPIVRRAGPGNPLGRLKFIFPNSHAVYMHDTPSKGLFETRVRTHSHGCIRVRNPARLAEVILGEVEGWSPEDVKARLAKWDTVQIDLAWRVPVHNTYFTLVTDASGGLTKLSDVYGHDRRILDALKGRSIKEIAATDPALALKRANKELAKSANYAPRRKKAPEGVAVVGAPGLFAPPGKKKPAPPPSYKSPAQPKFLFFQ